VADGGLAADPELPEPEPEPELGAVDGGAVLVGTEVFSGSPFWSSGGVEARSGDRPRNWEIISAAAGSSTTSMDSPP